MKLVAPLALTLVSCVAVVSHSGDAFACGGCFHGVDEANPSVVTGHRMALAVSPTRTVLWDQVEYAGDPAEFAWVLPVSETAHVEAADDAFFEALEAVTSTRVMSRIITCNGQSIQQQEFSGGCGSGSPGTATPTAAADEEQQQGAVRGVTVLHEGTVGPYETATIKSGDPMALRTWLTTNGYAIPADIDPVIDAYVAEGAAFIALRLQPGVGVRQMTPVRVVTPGASPILPLRMVAAGTGASVSIVLYVIGEGRYRAALRPEADEILAKDLAWDWALQQSDYATVRDARLAGGAFLTSFARPEGFTAPVPTTDGTPATYDVVWQTSGKVDTYDNLVDLYFGQAEVTDGAPFDCPSIHDKLTLADPGAQVVAPCDPADPSCVLPAGAISAADLECSGHADIATALLGMHPADVWVTRLEANLPREALDTDLALAAEPTQNAVDNWMVAQSDKNLPECNPPSVNPASSDVEGSGSGMGFGCGCSTRSSRTVDPMALAMAMVGILFGARRFARR